MERHFIERKVLTRSGMIFLAFNLVAWFIAAFLSSSLWAPAGAEQMSPAGFDVIAWVVVALPMVVITLALNAFWFARTWLRSRRFGWALVVPELWCLLFVALAWGGGVTFHVIHRYQGGL